jgi:type I restriction enzyme S subunit
VRYVSVPSEVPIEEIAAADACLSPGRYVRFVVPADQKGSHFAALDTLVKVRDSKCKADRVLPYRYAEIGDIDVHTGDVVFRESKGYYLPTRRPAVARNGDVLISTVRTYLGGIGLVTDTDDNLVTTNAMLDLCDVTDHAAGVDLLYVYAFLRSDFFTEQVWSMLNRGLYPRMDKGALHRILIPIPASPAAARWVSSLAQAIADKAATIRRRHSALMAAIRAELHNNQRATPKPSTADIRIEDIAAKGRLDAAVYSSDFRDKTQLITNYRHGYANLGDTGLVPSRGQNLQVSCIGKSIYSIKPRPGFYRLLLPTHISPYGTTAKFQWLGNARHLDVLREGDVVFGGEATFRCCVVCDALATPTIGNIHAIVLRSDELNLKEKVVMGAWLRFLGEWSYTRTLAAGGQGGSLAFDYLAEVLFPQFPFDVVDALASFYTNDVPAAPGPGTLQDFVPWHRARNRKLGIWELDREMKGLQADLVRVQEQIIEGSSVSPPLPEDC